jgi:hypothetical protein
MNKSDEYRASALACASFAATVDDPRAKAVLLSIAEGWVRLAEYLERVAPEPRDEIGAGNSPDQS